MERVKTAELDVIELVKKKTLEKVRIKKSPRPHLKQQQPSASAVPAPAIAYGPDLPDQQLSESAKTLNQTTVPKPKLSSRQI